MNTSRLSKNSDSPTKLASHEASTEISPTKRLNLLRVVSEFEESANKITQQLSQMKSVMKDEKLNVQLLHSQVIGKLVAERTEDLKSKLKSFTTGIRQTIEQQNTRSKRISNNCHMLQQSQRAFELQLIALRKRLDRLEHTLGY